MTEGTNLLRLMARVLTHGPGDVDEACTELGALSARDGTDVIPALCKVARAARNLDTDACELATAVGWHPDHPPGLEDMYTLRSRDEIDDRELGQQLDDLVNERVAHALPAIAKAIVDELRQDIAHATTMHEPVARILSYLKGDVAEALAARAARRLYNANEVTS